MILEHWDKVREIFDSIADQDAVERAFVLDRLDDPLRREVEWMLSNHDSAKRGGRMLDRPVPSNAELLGWLLEAQVFYSGDVLLDRFEIRRLLGRGGMGEVYEAFDRERSTTVAIKTVRFELRRQQSVVERFRREVKRSRMVNHKNVCQVYDMFTVEPADGAEIPFFSMELLEGPTLQDEMQRRDRFSREEALAIARGICAGLDEAHRRGVIHRDLKSSNVILMSDGHGKYPLAKITDFGLARELPSNGDSVITAITGELSGTLAYMAPELLEGKPAGKASDLYALGVVLYRMTTGKYPFAAEADLVSAAMRLRHPPVTPRRYVPSLPQAWETAILACLETEPAFRPRTATEVLSLLESDPKTTWRWAGKRSARHLRRRGFLFLGGLGAVAACWEIFGHRIWPAPFANRVGKVFVEDLETFEGVQAVARSTRNIVRVTIFGVPNLRVTTPAEVAGAIRTLNLGTTALRGAAAMRAAKQVGAEVLIGGKLQSMAAGTRVELWAVRVADGKVLHRSTDQGRGPRELAAAAHRASAAVAVALTGPALADASGPSVSAGSLDSGDADAVEEFTAGLDYFVHGQADNALLHLRRATEIDHDFATAWIYQATVAGTQRQDQAAFEAASRAYGLRERLGPRDRLQAQATYRNWIGDTHGFLGFQQQLVSEFPGESHLHRQIAQTYSILEMNEEAVAQARQAIELDPRSGNNYMVLAALLSQADRPEEALQAIRNGRKAGVSNAAALLSAEATPLMLKGEWQASQDALNELERQPGWDLHAREHVCRLLLLRGQLSTARDYLASSILLAESRSDPAHADVARYWLGTLAVLFLDRKDALLHAGALAARDPQPYRLFSFRAAAEVAYLANGRDVLAEAAQKLNRISTQYPSRRSNALSLQASGWSAALGGMRDDSVRRLQQARDLLGDVLNTWSLAELLRSYGTFSAAIPLYESVIARKGVALRWDQQASWICSFAQTARCYRALGRNSEAAKAYEQFLAYWGGQTQLPLVQQVLAEKALLPKG